MHCAFGPEAYHNITECLESRNISKGISGELLAEGPPCTSLSLFSSSSLRATQLACSCRKGEFCRCYQMSFDRGGGIAHESAVTKANDDKKQNVQMLTLCSRVCFGGHVWF